MKSKIYSRSEVEVMSPLLSRIADEMKVLTRDLREVVGRINTAETPKDREAMHRLCDRLQVVNDEVEDLGGVVYDYENGRFYFYADVAGEICHLFLHVQSPSRTVP